MQPLRVGLCLLIPVRVLQPLARGGRPDVQRPELQAVELAFMGPAGLQQPARSGRGETSCGGGCTYRETHAPLERDGQR